MLVLIELINIIMIPKQQTRLATQFALNSFNQPIIWLCGGLDRGNEFDELIPYMENVRAMVVFGQTKTSLLN